MNDRNGQVSRRDALRMPLGVGAGLALRPQGLWGHEARWDDRQAVSLVTKLIPSTGERLPVIEGHRPLPVLSSALETPASTAMIHNRVLLAVLAAAM